MTAHERRIYFVSSWTPLLFSVCILLAASGPTGAQESSKATSGGKREESNLPPKKVRAVPAELEACSKIIAFGGNCETDSVGHVVAVDLVFRETVFGERTRNERDCRDAIQVLSSFSKLETLKFPLSQISDSGLKEIGSLVQLHELRIIDKHYFPARGGPTISDAGIQHLKGLVNLENLAIHNSGLSDESMRVFGQMSSLKTLGLRGNNITDAGLAHLVNLKLDALWLDSTSVTHVGLAALVGLPLTTIGLSYCPIKDDGARELAEMKGLKSIWLDVTQVTDAGVAHLAGLPLEQLSIGGTRITDESGETIKQFEHLERLNFHGTRTTDKFLDCLLELENLEHITVSRACSSEALARIKQANPKIVAKGRWQHVTWENMSQIGTAMRQFHDEYGAFPMTRSVDAAGNPLVSWRVVILPFLGEQDLFDQFRFDEPWNSQHNATLVEKIPAVYVHPHPSKQSKPGFTVYQAVTGERCLLQEDSASHQEDAVDGIDETAIVIETTQKTAVPWTAPQDYKVDLDNPTRDLFDNLRLTYVVLANGNVRFFTDATDKALFKSLYTRKGDRTGAR